MDSKNYIISGGRKGADRLDILANATWPLSRTFLKQAGVKGELNVLDVGCGNGEITKRYCDFLDSGTRITCVDMDIVKLDIAREKLKGFSFETSFRNLNIDDLIESDLSNFDVIYCRFLLSHLSEPKKTFYSLKSLLKSGGKMIVEDIDFDGHFCFPNNDAYNCYVKAFIDLGFKRKANPLFARELPLLFDEADMADTFFGVQNPMFNKGDGKLMALITMEAIADGLVSEGLMAKDETERVISQLKEFTENEKSFLGLPRIVQICGAAR